MDFEIAAELHTYRYVPDFDCEIGCKHVCYRYAFENEAHLVTENESGVGPASGYAEYFVFDTESPSHGSGYDCERVLSSAAENVTLSESGWSRW